MTHTGFFDVFNRAISPCRIVVMGWGSVVLKGLVGRPWANV
jgi:hypothetical protein